MRDLKLPPVGIWGALLNGSYDATWVFMGWEGVEAKLQGIELNSFLMQDYGVPYGYAPCLLAHPKILEEEPEMVKTYSLEVSMKLGFRGPEIKHAMSIAIAITIT